MSDAPQLDPETIDRLRNGLRFIALRSLSDPDAAEEVVQETLARGLEGLRNGRPSDPAKIGAYLRGICRHVIVDTIRSRQRTAGLDSLQYRTNEYPHADALHVLISEEEKERVASALAQLPVASRECLRLSFYEGLKPAEIAERLGEPGPRIRKRLSRALEKLRVAFFDSAS